MKKKIVLAMAVIMVLGSVKAMAEEISMEDIEHGLAKIEATQEMNERLDEEEFFNENQHTKIDAAEADWRERQLEEAIGAKIKKMEEMKDSSQPSLNRSIIATIADAKKQLKENKFNAEGLQQLSTKLDNAWQTLNEMDQKNQIRGVRVHSELRY
ncbi:hypothetical protein EZJ49_03605 [Bdellovibrio bacteriovorus]|uniref:hypothetical protein n=1 Tax=Bdellovibrio bacteriovorus TaxID=959 RepID=UPI0021D2BE53|nr:hypothetical protein [Bdellovibrio bacteriovorus]UXR65336.1 hypothetical protein EZJ49_03605 [Bdellovibrio bacteriovorus]